MARNGSLSFFLLSISVCTAQSLFFVSSLLSSLFSLFFPARRSAPGGRRSRAAHAVKTDKNGIVRAVKQLLSRYLYVGPRLRESVSAIRPSFFRRRHASVRRKGRGKIFTNRRSFEIRSVHLLESYWICDSIITIYNLFFLEISSLNC